MPFTWKQSAGELFGPDGRLWAGGYSGHDDGVNNPDKQEIHDIGPIPQGTYSIGSPYDSPHTGPFTLPLTPSADTNTFGRSEFRIHGDSKTAPGTASHGCIILSRPVRECINREKDRVLNVVR